MTNDLTNDLFGIAASGWVAGLEKQSIQYNKINTILY